MTAKDPEAVIEYRGVVEGPRWAKFGVAIKDAAWADGDVELVALEEDVGWFRTTTRFALRGKRKHVHEFMRRIHKSIEDWNEGAL